MCVRVCMCVCVLVHTNFKCANQTLHMISACLHASTFLHVLIQLNALCPCRYKTQAALTERKRTRTLFLLMDVMQFFDLYHDGKLDIAIDVSKLTPDSSALKTQMNHIISREHF